MPRPPPVAAAPSRTMEPEASAGPANTRRSSSRARSPNSSMQQGPGEFDRLVLMAGPSFLGLLRAALSKPLRASLVAEVPKDLVHQGEDALRSHLTPQIFAK